MKTVNRIKPVGYGHFEVSIIFRNKAYKAVTTNTGAIDRINSRDTLPNRAIHCGYTYRQAEAMLFNEVKSKNNLK